MGMRYGLLIGGFTMDNGKPVILLYDGNDRETRIPYYGEDLTVDFMTEKVGKLLLVSADQALDGIYKILEST